MFNKIFIGLGVLVLLVVISASVLIYHASGWEENAIADTLDNIEIITGNIGSINNVRLNIESYKRKTRKVTIIAEGASGQGTLTGTITPFANRSEFIFNGVIKLPKKSYTLEFLFSGRAKNKENVKYKYSEVETDIQKVN